jgi:hypothetical protein
MVTRITSLAEDPQTLEVTYQNLVAPSDLAQGICAPLPSVMKSVNMFNVVTVTHTNWYTDTMNL